MSNLPNFSFPGPFIEDQTSFRELVVNVFSTILNGLKGDYEIVNEERIKGIENNIAKLYRQDIGSEIRNIQKQIEADEKELAKIPFGIDWVEAKNQIVVKEQRIKSLKKQAYADLSKGEAKDRAEKVLKEKKLVLMDMGNKYSELKNRISLNENELNATVKYVQERFGNLKEEILTAYDQSRKIFYNLAKSLEKNINNLEDDTIKSVLIRFLAYLTHLSK